MMELPWLCSACGFQNIVDMSALEKRVIDKLVTAEGFVCMRCRTWSVVFYWTQSLRDAMRKLDAMDEKRKDFRYHFAKAMRKAEGVQERMKAE